MQATGFEDSIPTGKGLFAWNSEDEAAEALDRVEADYAVQDQAARALALACFDAPAVLGPLLSQIESGPPFDATLSNQTTSSEP